MNRLLSRASTPTPKPKTPQEDKLARDSDVTVSTNVTLYAEYKGFFIYVLAAALLTVYIAWVLIPDRYLVAIGITYYPDKYWARAMPMYLLMAMLYTYVFTALYNTEILTFRLDDIRLFTDEHAVYPENPQDYIFQAPSGVWDLPVGLVNEVLYDT